MASHERIPAPETKKNDKENDKEVPPTLPPVSHQSKSIRRYILLAYSLVILVCLPVWWYMTRIQRLSLPNARIVAQEGLMDDLRFEIDILLRFTSPNPTWKAFLQTVEGTIDGCKQAHPEAWKGYDIKFINDPSEARGPDFYTVEARPRAGTHVIAGRHMNVFGVRAIDLGTMLCQLLNPTADKPSDQRVAQYSPTFRLAFTLLNEDISTGGQRGWAVEQNIERGIQPVLNQLSALHNFTVESQVQYYAPLAFEPFKRTNPNGEEYYALGEDELKTFVNSAEWTLSSKITNDPVLHFILFSPSAAHKPLLIHDEATDASLDQTNFIIPQWGGFLVFNAQHWSAPKGGAEIFSIFRSQLLALLGAPALPKEIQLVTNRKNPDAFLSDWQVDALMRRRTRENVEGSVQTLNSIVKLVDKLENMPVGMDVKGDVLRALEELEAMRGSKSTLDLFTHSRAAYTLSSKAFFNPGMVGQLYFPAEHKYAIYMLFAPASMPLIVMLIREIRDWRKAKKEHQKTE